MTILATTTDQADPFWKRVRAALGALRPVHEPAYGQAAIARSIGMKPKLGTLIEEELVQGWNAAAARHVSLSLLVIEIDRAAEYFTTYDKDATDECVFAVMQAVTDSLPRAGDSCLRMGRSGFVVVLPDLPVLIARTLAHRITESVRHLALSHKESHAGVVTVSLGLAVTNPEGNYDRRFFEAGAEAVKKAQRKGLGYLQVTDLRPEQDRKRKPGQRVLNAA